MNVHSRDCPHPSNGSPEEIEFERQPMVDWLEPNQLAKTGIKTMLAATFGSYADRREMQAALAPIDDPDDDYSDQKGELWFDYVADVGDGFDSTYAIARLLATDLTLKVDEAPHDTKRGQFLVLGGDEVYPTAVRDEYRNRFIGPYRAAFPWVEDKLSPAMYAIPGNHDWYDGLTSFLRLFCQRQGNKDGRWIGGWRTRQRRSYFAIRLPQNWWIWGVDSQLESDLDQPQLRYFDSISRTMGPDSKLILAVASPDWVECPAPGSDRTCRNDPERFNTLAHFEKTYVRRRGIQLKLVVSGDMHHYIRYVSDCEPETHTTRVTAGGGGASLVGTAQIPECLLVPEGTDEALPTQEPRHRYAKKQSYPDSKQSHDIGHGIWKLPAHNLWLGALVLGPVYLLLAWLLQAGSRINGGSLLHTVQTGSFRAVASAFLNAFLFNPLASALGSGIVLGFFFFASKQSKGYPRMAKWLGLVHGVLHVILCCAILGIVAWVLNRIFDLHAGETSFILIAIAGVWLLGWFLGALLFAMYLWFASRATGLHKEEAFSSMGIADYKNFLRMRLGANGTLRVYAIGLRSVPHDWEFRAPGPNEHGVPWFRSAKFMKNDYAPHVIETFELT